MSIEAWKRERERKKLERQVGNLHKQIAGLKNLRRDSHRKGCDCHEPPMGHDYNDRLECRFCKKTWHQQQQNPETCETRFEWLQHEHVPALKTRIEVNMQKFEELNR